MRFLFKAEMPVETANELVRKGTLGPTIQSILDDLKPEAVYFATSNGKRCAFIILDINDACEMPRIGEPWMLAFNATIEFSPAMVPEDLAKAGEDFEKAVAKYGK